MDCDLQLTEEEALKYPMKYKFPELGDHWGEEVQQSAFVTSKTYDKAYSRIEELERDKLEILGHHDGYQVIIKNLENQIKELKEKHQCFNVCWISVDEMLPDFDELVLCCLESGYDGSPKYQFMTRHYEDEGWYWCDHNGDGDDYPVTHWIPLPATPPKYEGLKAEVW